MLSERGGTRSRALTLLANLKAALKRFGDNPDKAGLGRTRVLALRCLSGVSPPEGLFRGVLRDQQVSSGVGVAGLEWDGLGRCIWVARKPVGGHVALLSLGTQPYLTRRAARVQTDFYLLVLRALYPKGSAEDIEETVGRERSVMSLLTCGEAIRLLVLAPDLQKQIAAQLEHASAAAMKAGNVSFGREAPLDDVLEIFLEEWERPQRTAALALQRKFMDAFFGADNIGLGDFIALLRTLDEELPPELGFRIYNNALAMSERALGVDTDVILADAFVEVALACNRTNTSRKLFRCS